MADEFGFKALNTNTVIQIDSNYQNMALRLKGTLACNTLFSSGGVYDWYYGTLTVSNTQSPIAAVNSVNRCFMLRIDQIDSTTVKYTWVTQGVSNIDYYIFDKGLSASSAEPDEWDLVIRRSDGSISFDSRLPYMRIVGMFAGDRANDTDPLWQVDSEAAFTPWKTVNIAIIQGSLIYDNLVQPLDPGNPNLYFHDFFAGTFRVSNSAAWLGYRHLYTEGPLFWAGGDSTQLQYSYLAVDITGL